MSDDYFSSAINQDSTFAPHPPPTPTSDQDSARLAASMNSYKWSTGAVTVEKRPLQIGPWRIKRSQSVPEVVKKRPTYYGDGRRPSLAQTLAAVDEQCAAIEDMTSSGIDLEHHISLRGLGTPSTKNESLQVHEQTESRSSSRGFRFAGDDYVTALLLFCCAMLFVLPAVITYAFASVKMGPIVLLKEAPTRTTLGIVLGLLCISVGTITSTALCALLTIRRGLIRTRRIRCLLALACLVFTGLLTAWNLAILLPIVDHA